MSESLVKEQLELIEGIQKYLNDSELLEEQYDSDFRYLKKELEVLKGMVNGDVPGAKFEIGEFVIDCRYGEEEVREIGNRSFTEERGWVYAINYVTIDKRTRNVSYGGSSAWWDEKDFKKLNNPVDRLIIEKHKLNEKLTKNKRESELLKKAIEKIVFSLEIIGGNDNE